MSLFLFTTISKALYDIIPHIRTLVVSGNIPISFEVIPCESIVGDVLMLLFILILDICDTTLLFPPHSDSFCALP
jgi:hypothetical protein